jgi:hypothetical protein
LPQLGLPDEVSRQYRGLDRALAIEDNLLALTDEGGVVLIVRQKSEYRRVVTTQLQARFVSERFVKAV